MAEIKVEIHTQNDNITLYNEDIISLSTSSRSTSSPSTPIYGAFASDGTIVIRDENLALYKKAQQGFFDNYSYPVKIYLYNDESEEYEQIADQVINRRPEYDYTQKTLSFSLSDKIAVADNLVYDGYAFPLGPKTAYDIFKDVAQKFFALSNNAFIDLMNTIAYVDSSTSNNITFKEVYEEKVIQYPYLPEQITYREALASVLSLTHCALIIDTIGSPRLIYLDKFSNEVEDNEIAILTPDKTQEAFNTSIILDNKYDNAQVGATFLEKYYNQAESVNIYFNEEQLGELTEMGSPSSYVLGTTYPQEIPQNSNIVGFKYRTTLFSQSSIVALKIDNVKYNGKRNLNIRYSKYANNNLKKYYETEKALTRDNLAFTIKQIKKITEGTCTISTYADGVTVNSLYDFDQTTNTETEEKIYEDIYIPLNMGVREFVNDAGGFDIYVNWDIEDITNFSRVPDRYDEENYIAYLLETYMSLSFISYFAKQNDSINNNATTIDNVPCTKIEYEYIPVFLNVVIENTTEDILLNDIIIKNTELARENIGEVTSYGKLLQNGLNIPENIITNEISHIVNYYNNGVHTADITVLGNTNYERVKPQIYTSPYISRLFQCGDIVEVQNYDYESPLNYNSADYTTEMPLKWQVTENVINFDGGAISQALTLKELPFAGELSGAITYTNALPISYGSAQPQFRTIQYYVNNNLNILTNAYNVEYSGYIEYTGLEEKLKEIKYIYNFENVNPATTTRLQSTVQVQDSRIENYSVDITFRNSSGNRQAYYTASAKYIGGSNINITEDTKLVFTAIKVYYN